MYKESTTSGLGLDKIKELLTICSEGDLLTKETSSDQQKAELLNDWLAVRLSSESFRHAPLPKKWAWLCNMSGLSRGETIRDYLTNPQTSASTISQLKDYCKEFPQTAVSKDELDIAKTIYYAAIAHALAFQRVKITDFSHKDLECSFRIFKKKTWIPSDLRSLFEKACEYCKSKGQDKD